MRASVKARVNALTEWSKSNPLKVWRQSQLGDMGVRTAAGLLEVNVSTVQAWERGSARPTEESLQRIGQLIQAPNIQKQWDEWLEERPTV
ncbi:MAG: hypothetical protein ACJ8LM_16745 [Candidatus Udaeobacter sp.]